MTENNEQDTNGESEGASVDEFNDGMSTLLTDFINKAAQDSSIISKWVVVAEVVDFEDRYLVSMKSDSVNPWDSVGMLRTELGVIETGYSDAVTAASMYLRRQGRDEDDE